MRMNEISRAVLDAAYRIHTRLGPGLLESVYEVVLAHELRKGGLKVERQVAIPIRWDDVVFEVGFRADLVVENAVIVELKSVAAVLPVHGKQLLTQLRLSDCHLGLLINFGELHLKNGIKRVVHNLPPEDDAPPQDITL